VNGSGPSDICPITNTVKGWPFEVELPEGLAFQGAILTDEVKSLDWKSRRIQIIDEAPPETVTDCLNKIHTFL
jgi:mRNA interferase MazF